MLASELIIVLQEAIDKVGDLPVFGEVDWEWVDGVEYERPKLPEDWPERKDRFTLVSSCSVHSGNNLGFLDLTNET